jgi:hypothetical protein
VQNGVLKNELLARVFGFSRVLGAMADFSGELLANGEVKFTRNVCLHIGEEKGGASPRADELAAAIDTCRGSLRGGFQHPHARMVQVRRLDRAVSAGGADAADHLEIPHGRTQRHGHRAHRALKRRNSQRP